MALSDNWVVEDPKKKVNWFDLFNPRHLKIIETNAFQVPPRSLFPRNQSL